jgi:hypothetical protein
MPLPQRFILIAALAAVFCIVLIAVPAAATGSIKVFSDPTDAYVCIDNYQCGYTTEQFDGLSANAWHTVTVSMDGYQAYTESDLVTESATSVVNVNLQPVLVSMGSIEVHSTPYGATACIDGGDCQQTTASFTNLAGNSYHSLTISATGYQTYFDNVFVTARQTSVVDATLQPVQPATGIVQVFITPGGGTVCLDNQCEQNVGTPGASGSHQFANIPANGYHTVTVTANGYQRYITEIYVQPGQLNELTISLQPLASPTGTLQVYVTPGGGIVCLDGSQCDANVGTRDSTGSMQFARVLANTPHTVTVVTSGYLTYTKDVTLQPGQVNELDITLTPGTSPTMAPTAAPVQPTAAPTSPPAPVPTAPAPRPTTSDPGALPVLGALALCGAVLISRKK